MSAQHAVWPFFFWPQLAGTIFLLAGVIAVRRQLAFRLDALPVLGRAFVPAALGAFGAEHLVSANSIMQLVPAWMPGGRLFWTYFVGCALFAAAISMVSMRYVRLSAFLLGCMFFLFVLSLHLPIVLRNPRDRFAWAVALRDSVFGVGAWALAASWVEERRVQATRSVIAVLRVVFALVLLFFGAEHLLHPAFTPGVPLPQLTAPWIPLRSLWGYCTGAMLVISGVLMLANRRARAGATWLGIVVTLAVIGINLPMRVVASQPSEIVTAVNYIFDTLLFAGSIFLLAAALPGQSSRSNLLRESAS